MAASERIFDLLDEPIEIVDSPNPVEPPPFQGRLEFDNVWFAYGPGRPSAKTGCCADSPSGGARRAGRAGRRDRRRQDLDHQLAQPLLRAAARPRSCSTGWTSATTARTTCAAAWQSSCRTPSSSPARSPATSACWTTPSTSRSLRWAAEYVNAAPFIERLPDGYQTEVHERGAGLSVGQKQLLAFARAIASPARTRSWSWTKPPPASTRRPRPRSRTRCEADGRPHQPHHRPPPLDHPHADRILVLHQGRLIEQGSHAELLAQGGQYARLYELQYQTQEQEVTFGEPTATGGRCGFRECNAAWCPGREPWQLCSAPGHLVTWAYPPGFKPRAE